MKMKMTRMLAMAMVLVTIASVSNGQLAVDSQNTEGAKFLVEGASGTSTNLSEYNNDAGFITDYVVTEADVTNHQAAIRITESQIIDLGKLQEGVDASEGTNKVVVFAAAFAAEPTVAVSLSEDPGELAHVYVTEVSTTNFSYVIRNGAGLVTNDWSVGFVAADKQ